MSRTNPNPNHREVDVSRLKVGFRLQAPLNDSRGLLLLAAGIPISQQLLDRFAQRGIKRVLVHVDDLAALDRATGKTPQSPPAARQHKSAPKTLNDRRKQAAVAHAADKRHHSSESTPFASSMTRHGKVRYDAEMQSLAKEHIHGVGEELKSIYSSGSTSVDRGDVLRLSGICDRSLNLIAADCDAVLSTSNEVAPSSPSASTQATLTTMVAMSTAAHLGYPATSIRELGLGCLLHVMGQQVLARANESQQSGASFANVRGPGLRSRPAGTHDPLAVFELLNRAPHVPVVARLVAYQIHERIDGSGAPRGRKGSQVHELSRIAAVADAYATLLLPSKSGHSFLPYEAVEQLLYATQRGEFEPRAVRGLLTAVSLFPVGSWCELSDGRAGCVLRTQPSSYAKPLLEAWRELPPRGPGELVDLELETSISIRRPIEVSQKFEPDTTAADKISQLVDAPWIHWPEEQNRFQWNSADTGTQFGSNATDSGEANSATAGFGRASSDARDPNPGHLAQPGSIELGSLVAAG